MIPEHVVRAAVDLGSQIARRDGSRLVVVGGEGPAPAGDAPDHGEWIAPAGAATALGPTAGGATVVWVDDEPPPAPLAAALAAARWGVIAAPPGATSAARVVEHLGLPLEFGGWGPAPWGRTTDATMAIWWGARPPARPVPEGFRVVAVMAAYNEADVLRPTVLGLLAQGIDVFVVDNWSTDATVDSIADLVGHGVLGVDRWPPTGPTATYDWRGLLGRLEAVTAELDADWFVFQDPDERRDGPWAGRDLRTSLWTVDQAGFNAVDHSMIEFRPVDDTFVPGTAPWEHFDRFEFTQGSVSGVQVKCWHTEAPADLSSSGGHDVSFPDRRIFPVNFLLRHYPIRSQAHGERKVLRERLGRMNEAEFDAGWHQHYDRIVAGHRFLRDPSTLLRYDVDFAERHLVSRLGRLAMPSSPQPVAERLRQRSVRLLRAAGVLRPAARAVHAARRRRRG